MGEVSNSHRGAMGFILSMFFLQSFRFETFFVYELKVDSFITAIQHSQIGSLINNSTRFKNSMHVSFVSTNIHENLQCHNGFWEYIAYLTHIHMTYLLLTTCPTYCLFNTLIS
jgi:hypothetical protein